MAKNEIKAAIDAVGYLLQTLICQKFYAGRFCGAHEAVDHSLRRVTHREDAPILLGFKSNTARFKPFNGIMRLKELERRQQCRTAARIVTAQLAAVEASVGDIAAAAT